eukprot:5321300-Pleurochrysis_carterae.AAC.1
MQRSHTIAASSGLESSFGALSAALVLQRLETVSGSKMHAGCNAAQLSRRRRASTCPQLYKWPCTPQEMARWQAAKL